MIQATLLSGACNHSVSSGLPVDRLGGDVEQFLVGALAVEIRTVMIP
jgi:hypothetical protein